MKIKKIPESELEVMKVIWKYNENLSSKEITSILLESKGWKSTTVLTLITRLVNKNILDVYKKGRFSYYNSKLSEDEYIKSETQSFFQKIHNGSLKNFITTLHETNDISNDELNELTKWIKDKE